MLRKSIASLCLLIVLGACSGPDEAARMASAAEYQQAGQYRAAVIELKNVLKANPDNAQARLQLGLLSLVIGDAAGAQYELERAVQAGIPERDVMVPLARALIAQGKGGAAIDRLDPEAAADAGQRAEVLALWGHALSQVGLTGEARLRYEESLRIDPDGLEPRIGKARLARADGDLQRAQALLQEALTLHPESIEAVLALARLRMENGQYAAARSGFEVALAQTPRDRTLLRIQSLSGLTEAQIAQGDHEAAADTLDQLAEYADQHPGTEFLRARLAFDRRDFEAAEDHLTRVLARAPGYVPAQLLQGAVKFALGDYVQAEMFLQAVVAETPNNKQALRMLQAARVQLAPESALEALTAEASEETPDAHLLAMLADASMRSGDAAAAVDHMRRSVASAPDDPALQLKLAATYIIARQFENALAVLETASTQNKGQMFQRELMYAIVLVNTAQFEPARERARALVEREPDDARAQLLAGAVELAAGESDAARAYYERAAELDRDSVAPVLNLARLDQQRGDGTQARTRLARYLEDHPDNLQALVSLAQLDEAAGNRAAAIARLQRAQSSDASAVAPRLLLARLYLSEGRPADALAAASAAVKLLPGNPQGHILMGQAQLGQRDPAAALESFRAAEALSPDAPELLFHKARALSALERGAEARETLERLMAVAPSYLPGGVLLATLHIQAHDLEAAQRVAGQLSEAHPDRAAPYALFGDIHLARGEFQEAAGAFADALEREPASRYVARLYAARGRAGDEAAIDTVTAWLSEHPEDASVRLLLAQHYDSQGRQRDAIAEYERVLASNPGAAVALNNLAWLYFTVGDERAIELAERAHRAQPDAGAITDTLGWLLVQSGQLERGTQMLRQAWRQAEELEIGYHLAAALVQRASEGDLAEARDILQRLLASGRPFQSRSEAERLLAQL